MNFQNIVVKRVSSEIIKPSSPTPSHLRHLTLSFLDQKCGPSLIPALLFYSAPQGAARLDITRLKTCLSETLTTFYPLAGRYETWGTILCNDEGIPFTESQVNCTLSDMLNSFFSSSSSFEYLPSFYPPKQDILPSRVHMAIQVNVFTCGGFALGWYHVHKVTDGTSATTFLRHWAALVAENYEGVTQAQPDFKAGPTTFPPLPEEDTPVVVHESDNKEEKFETKGDSGNDKTIWSSISAKRTILRSFIFKSSAMNELKAKSISDGVPNPSRYEAVTGFLWKQLLSTSTTTEKQSTITVAVNLRPITDPPLPKGSMGNIVDVAIVNSNKQAQLPELVEAIHSTIAKMTDSVLNYQSENRGEHRDKHSEKFKTAILECMGKDAYMFLGWCKSAGFMDVDFGFGKPIRVIPNDGVVVNISIIILTEYLDLDGGDGYEAWLFLEEDIIKSLESSPDFLAFASPSFRFDNNHVDV
ncbi:hypothetical protein RND81_04G031600 [Saponaria officinalis]|uniref:Transferase n=1 Tax=Saponaria officinalis TaxID=3572 RepID=A0AAW1LHE5_SAPOF